MGAAIEDVEAGHWQHRGIGPAEALVQRGTFRHGTEAGGGHGDAQDGVGAQAALVGRTVQFDHHLVQDGLGGQDLSHQFRSDFAHHRRGGAQHALAAEALGIAIPALQSLVLAGGLAGGH